MSHKSPSVLMLLQYTCFNCTIRVSWMPGLQMLFCDTLFYARGVVEALECVGGGEGGCRSTLIAMVVFSHGSMLVSVI